MDGFQSIESGNGILKNDYAPNSEGSAMSAALKKRRKKLMESKGLESGDDEREGQVL